MNPVLSALIPNLVWGFMPLFWNLLRSVSPFEILIYRVVCSCLFMSIFLVSRSFRSEFVALFTLHRERLYWTLLSGAFIGLNWYIFVTAMVEQRILESSLGYFLSPLASVLLGVVLLKERLNRSQKLAMILAAIAVLIFASRLDRPPIFALSMALTFAFYGYFKVRAKNRAELGIFVETLFLTPFLFPFFFGVATPHEWKMQTLLLVSGPATAIPLVWYAQSIHRVPYSVVGFLQYASPIIQFVLALAYYHEPLHATKAVGFGILWIALGLFTWDLKKKSVS